VASELSYPQSLTHAALARGPIWSCAFGTAMLHGCTPLCSYRLRKEKGFQPACDAETRIWCSGDTPSVFPI